MNIKCLNPNHYILPNSCKIRLQKSFTPTEIIHKPADIFKKSYCVDNNKSFPIDGTEDCYYQASFYFVLKPEINISTTSIIQEVANCIISWFVQKSEQMKLPHGLDTLRMLYVRPYVCVLYPPEVRKTINWCFDNIQLGKISDFIYLNMLKNYLRIAEQYVYTSQQTITSTTGKFSTETTFDKFDSVLKYDMTAKALRVCVDYNLLMTPQDFCKKMEKCPSSIKISRKSTIP